jgi:hypothetical protein
VEVTQPIKEAPRLRVNNEVNLLREMTRAQDLKAFTWTRANGKTIACFDLPKGGSVLELGG